MEFKVLFLVFSCITRCINPWGKLLLATNFGAKQVDSVYCSSMMLYTLNGCTEEKDGVSLFRFPKTLP